MPCGASGILSRLADAGRFQRLLRDAAALAAGQQRAIHSHRRQRALPATGLWKAEVPAVTPTADMPVMLTGGAYPHRLPLVTLEGKALNLSDLKDKVVFVNRWARWCPPCRAEMPGIEALYQKIDKSKVAFVML